MSITSSKQTIIIHNFNFDEKTLFRFKRFFEKNDKIASFFPKIMIKLRLKIFEDQLIIF